MTNASSARGRSSNRSRASRARRECWLALLLLGCAESHYHQLDAASLVSSDVGGVDAPTGPTCPAPGDIVEPVVTSDVTIASFTVSTPIRLTVGADVALVAPHAVIRIQLSSGSIMELGAMSSTPITLSRVETVGSRLRAHFTIPTDAYGNRPLFVVRQNAPGYGYYFRIDTVEDDLVFEGDAGGELLTFQTRAVLAWDSPTLDTRYAFHPVSAPLCSHVPLVITLDRPFTPLDESTLAVEVRAMSTIDVDFTAHTP